jgi:polysaccharide pyruvyl transferase WcaK-like protein
LIFSAGHGVPLVGLVYDPKVSAFLNYIGQKYYTELDNVDAEGLLKLVRASIGGSSPETQKAAVERLRGMEMVNRRALLRLLENQTRT